MKRSALVMIALFSVTPALAKEPTTVLAAVPQKSPDVQLSDGKLAYERGDYPLAVRTLVPLLYPSIALTTEEAVVEAHRILALSYLLQKQEANAEEEATSILALKPAFQLDPIVDPPMAVAFFDGVRKKQDSRLRELRDREKKELEARAKEEERLRRQNAERIFIERTVEHHSRLVATVPFGVGQFQNHQTVKGALFASGELLFGALSLSCYLAIDQRYPYDPTTNTRYYPKSEASQATALLAVQLGSGIAFWGTMLWGIIDAHVLFKREIVKTREVAAPKHAFQFSPVVGQGSGGLAVRGDF